VLVHYALEHRRWEDDAGGSDYGGYGGYGQGNPVSGGVLDGLLQQLLGESCGSVGVISSPLSTPCQNIYRDKPRGWLRAQVFHAAAGDEAAITALGRSDEARAFFQWLRCKEARAVRPAVDAAAGRVSLPGNVSGLIGDFASEGTTPIAFLAELQEFSDLDEVKGEDKNTALRHVRGPRRHDAWLKFLATLSRK
jgi:hypothetical protein